MIVKFDCGCIGLADVPGDPEGHSFILKPCDLGREDPSGPCLDWRDMDGKSYVRLPDKDALVLLGEICTLVRDGHNFRAIKRLIS